MDEPKSYDLPSSMDIQRNPCRLPEVCTTDLPAALVTAAFYFIFLVIFGFLFQEFLLQNISFLTSWAVYFHHFLLF